MGKWTEAATDRFGSTHDALQLVYDNLNKGQRNKLLKIAEIKELFNLYEVNYEE